MEPDGMERLPPVSSLGLLRRAVAQGLSRARLDDTLLLLPPPREEVALGALFGCPRCRWKWFLDSQPKRLGPSKGSNGDP